MAIQVFAGGEELRRLELSDVELTGKEHGRGSYGYVVGLRVKGLRCAGKCLHDSFFDCVSDREMNSVANTFSKECVQHSKLNHPNIVQCLGVYTHPQCKLPMLVMEYMPMSLRHCLETYSMIPSSLKYRMLLGVATGLSYLHNHDPTIVHRDLTANNVLLSESMHAKIADFGVSRIIPADRRDSTLTKVPGTPIYMPPEALGAVPRYDKSLDIFSFGVLIVHVVSQVCPIPDEATRLDENDRNKVVALTEVERRARYLDMMTGETVLESLAKRCLHNDPDQRPQVSDITAELEQLASNPHSDVPFSNHVEALQLLSEHQEAKDKLLSQACSLQAQLVTILEDVTAASNWSESTHANLIRQLQLAMNTVDEMVDGRVPSYGGQRFIFRYSHPSMPQQACDVKLNLVSQAALPNPSNSTLVVRSPINMTFRGTYVKTIASNLYKAWGVATSKAGQVFIVDHNGPVDSLLCYSSDGTKSTLVQSARLYELNPPVERSWYPSGVAVVNDRTLLLADSGNKRLLKLQLPELPGGEVALVAQTERGLFEGSRSIASPVGVAVSNSGSVFVCDREHHRLMVFDSNLTLQREFGSEGVGPSQFAHPWDVACDSQSNVYVSDCSNVCIKVFTPDLRPLRTIGSAGNKPTNLRAPTGICIDANDYLYVADKNLMRVFVFDPTGQFKMYFGGFGSENGQFVKPLGIAVDQDGYIYVSDGEGGRVQVFA